MTTIRYRDGRVKIIQYVLVDLPSVFEKRGRRFRPAWRVK